MVLEKPISIILPSIGSNEKNKNVIPNDSDYIKTQWFWNIFYVSLVLILYFFYTFPVLLFPQHKSRIWCIIIDLQYKGLSLLFNMLYPEIQWILAFILPLIREANYNILIYIMFKSPRIEDSGEENLVIGMYGYSALYVAIRLGQTTTNMTSILILLVDFSLNLHTCYQIINFYRSTVPMIQFVSIRFLKMRDFALSKLVINRNY